MERLEKFIQKIENWEISFWQIFFLFFANFFLRTFFENLTNSSNINRINGLTDTLFHYPLWYFGVFLSVILIFYFLTRVNILKIARVVAVFSFIIFLPPLIDMVVYWGRGHVYNFIIGGYTELLHYFLSVLVLANAISLGIKIEIILSVILGGIYVFLKTTNLFRAVVGSFLIYSAIFLFLTAPVHMMALYQKTMGYSEIINTQNISKFYLISDQYNSRTNFRTSVFDQNNFESLSLQTAKNRYSETLVMFFLICDLIIISLLYFLSRPSHFLEIVKNFRPTRIIHYFFLTGLGVYLGWIFSGNTKLIGSLYDLLSFISLFLAILFAWLFAVWENDEVDKEIDEISSPGRPLVNGVFEKTEWRDIKFVFLLFALSFAWLAGFYVFTFIVVYILVYHIYSTPPLRLKRFFGISSLVIAINALLAVWAGFFLFSRTENLRDFPPKYSFGLLIIYLLAENVKNLKDIEGDCLAGIKTLPVLLGKKRGKLLVGVMVFGASLLAPVIFFLNWLTFLTAAIFGAILFLLINRQQYSETPVFLVYFIFAVALVLELILGQ